jgi:hypothetical protein
VVVVVVALPEPALPGGQLVGRHGRSAALAGNDGHVCDCEYSKLPPQEWRGGNGCSDARYKWRALGSRPIYGREEGGVTMTTRLLSLRSPATISPPDPKYGALFKLSTNQLN